MRIVDDVNDYDHDVTVLSSDEVWKGHILDIRNDTIELHPGEPPIEREYVAHPGAVGIVALHTIDGVDHICLVNQYRHAIKKVLWEIPAGLTDIEGEGDLHAAKRELAEEAGLGARQWDVLVDLYTTPGASTEGLRVFLARDIYDNPIDFQREDEEKDMEAVWISLDNAYRALCEGKIHNPSTVVGVLSTMAAKRRGWQTLRDATQEWSR